MYLNKDFDAKQLKQLSLGEKKKLCDEIRSVLIDTISRTGGHLASNLGTVELCVALHSVFTTPEDKIVFDVGHQCYTHKLLTGRYERFETLRTKDGISGFPRPSESPHDAFIGGHSSVSVSAALGIAKGMELSGKSGHVVAVIGDGAFTGGEAFEGINNAGKYGKNLIIVLNDNEMSISKNSGAVATYLQQIRATKKYYETKDRVKEFLGNGLLGRGVKKTVHSTKNLVKYAIYQSNMFENLGFNYYGPLDGHNIKELCEAFEVAKLQEGPCIIHVKTKKGKGFTPSEENSGKYHSIDKKANRGNKSETNTEVFGRALLELGKADERICVISAAMKYATGCNYFNSEFRDRFFDVGIAEEHAVTFACGLASEGMLPVFAVYSTFLQRAYDQLIHDASIEKYHIVLAVDRAGVVGEDGETHQGEFDVAMLSTVPNATIYAPYTSSEIELALKRALYATEGIAAVRYSKGAAAIEESGEQCLPDFRYGEKNSDTLVVTYGRLTGNAKRLSALGTDFLQLIKIFPIEERIVEIIRGYRRVFVFEEGIKSGGIGEKLAMGLTTAGFAGSLKIFAIDNEFVKVGDYEEQLSRYSLDFDGMRRVVFGDGEVPKA